MIASTQNCSHDRFIKRKLPDGHNKSWLKGTPTPNSILVSPTRETEIFWIKFSIRDRCMQLCWRMFSPFYGISVLNVNILISSCLIHKCITRNHRTLNKYFNISEKNTIVQDPTWHCRWWKTEEDMEVLIKREVCSKLVWPYLPCGSQECTFFYTPVTQNHPTTRCQLTSQRHSIL